MPDEMPWDQTGRTNKLPLSQWAQWGVTNPDGTPLIDNGLKAGLALPMGRKGPAFLTYDNFDVYLRVEPVLHLRADGGKSRRPAGRRTAVRSAHSRNRPRRRADEGAADKARSQEATMSARVDGILGTNTREAIRKEQMRLGLPVDGWPTPELLARL